MQLVLDYKTNAVSLMQRTFGSDHLFGTGQVALTSSFL